MFMKNENLFKSTSSNQSILGDTREINHKNSNKKNSKTKMKHPVEELLEQDPEMNKVETQNLQPKLETTTTKSTLPTTSQVSVSQQNEAQGEIFRQEHFGKLKGIDSNDKVSLETSVDNKVSPGLDAREKKNKSMGFKQTFKGNHPNVEWKAYSKDDLEKNSQPNSYTSLKVSRKSYLQKILLEKEQKELTLSTESSSTSSTCDTTRTSTSDLLNCNNLTDSYQLPNYLYEQHSDQWFDSRKSHLTASNFSTVLGFFEKKSASYLGLSSSFVSHQKMESICLFLRKQYWKKMLIEKKMENMAYLFEDSKDAYQFGEGAMINMDWGTHHEQNAILTFLDAFPDFHLKETGLWSLDSDAHLPCKDKMSPFFCEFNELPKLGASPDGLIYNKTNSMNDDMKPFALLEVKCPSPFREQFPTSKSVPKHKYLYRKRSPHSNIPTYYLPQIMGQMLVTQVKEAYFISWTATDGSNVIQLSYDETYVSIMLKLFRDFYQDYVVKPVNRAYEELESILNLQKENYSVEYKKNIIENELLKEFPPEDLFFERDYYVDFLNRSMEITKKAKIVKNISKSMLNSVKNSPLFLDDIITTPGNEQKQEDVSVEEITDILKDIGIHDDKKQTSPNQSITKSKDIA